MILAIIVFCYVGFVRNRKCHLIILTPCFIGAASISSIVASLLFFTMSGDDELWDNNQDLIRSIFALNNFFALMGYQVFGALYLRTSLMLPKLFKEAKLEFFLNDTKKNKHLLESEDINMTENDKSSILSRKQSLLESTSKGDIEG